MPSFDRLAERVLDLAGDAGSTFQKIAPRASGLMAAGVGSGLVRRGARLGLKVARRNPAMAAATIAGAGLLWYAAKKRAQRAEEAGSTLDGTARRIDPQSGTTNASRSPDTGFGVPTPTVHASASTGPIVGNDAVI